MSTSGTGLPAALTVASLSLTTRPEKSTPPRRTPIGGMMMSLTSELTTLPSATPMMTPTASASAFVLSRNALNSASMCFPLRAWLPADEVASLVIRVSAPVPERRGSVHRCVGRVGLGLRPVDRVRGAHLRSLQGRPELPIQVLRQRSGGDLERRTKRISQSAVPYVSLQRCDLALAVGVIIGVALGGVVNSLVNDIIMPPIGVLLGGVDFSSLVVKLKDATVSAAGKPVSEVDIRYGTFVNVVIAFLVVALVVFLMARVFLKEAPATPTKTCPFCKESNAVDASKCKACTSAI